MHINLNASSKQDGFTLLEILVTVIILAIGLLGIASLQNTAVKFSYDSYLRSQASILSYDLMDRVRSNPTSENYNLEASTAPTGTAEACNGNEKNCSADEIAAADLAEWYQQALTVFPDSTFTLARADNEDSGNVNYTLTISWEDRYENDVKEGNAATGSTAENQRAEFEYTFDVRGI